MNKPKHREKGLGMGLDALLGDTRPAEPERASGTDGSEGSASAPSILPLDRLVAGALQPRTAFEDEAIETLAASIREHGVMQPILVRPLAADSGRFEIIAGERRFRAARVAGLVDIPVVIRDLDDRAALALALIENIQREDLNPIDEARGIQRLIDEFGYSHDTAADAVGRSRSATTNILRLLKLAEPVQRLLIEGRLGMGHGRALLALETADQIAVAGRVAEEQWSVRETERLVAANLAQYEADRVGAHYGGADATAPAASRRAAALPLDRDLERLQTRLSDLLAAEVRVRASPRGRGKLVIGFADNEQFVGLLERLGLADALDHDA